MAYNDPNLNSNGCSRAFWILAIIIFAITFVGLYLPHSGSREGANRVKCSANLRDVGQAMMIYAADHGGQYPDCLQTLMSYQHLYPETFICPSTTDVPAPGATSKEQASNLVATSGKRHLSYEYAARGVTSQASADTILAYEPLSNHGNAMNVLFGDGHVDRLWQSEGEKLIAELQSGHNPPRPEKLK